jgi:surface-anchored protein/uncharacterized repeat protein (TIGR01451 family)
MKRLSLSFGLLLLVALAGRGTGGVTAAPSHEFVLSVGHSDAFDVAFENDQLELSFADDTTGGHIERDPADVLMHAKPESGPVPAPGSGAFAFLGPPGTQLWVLPQTQDPNLLWPGLSTEELTGTWTDNQIRLQLLSVSGPGNFFLFQNDQFGGPIQMWYSTNLGNVGSFPVTPGVHAHFNWVFTAQGTYTLTVQASGTHTTQGAKSTGPVDYTVHVGPVANLAVTKSGSVGQAQVGDRVTFTVTASNAAQPPTSTGCCTDATGVMVNDLLPAGVSFQSASAGAGSYDSGSGVWSIGNLAYGASATLEIAATVTAQAAGLTVTNTASIASSMASLLDIDPDNNAASASVQVGNAPTATPTAGTTSTPGPTATPTATPSPTPDPSSAAQTINVEVLQDGGLTISVGGDQVVLPAPQLNGTGDALVTGGPINPVTVIDLRMANPGWNVSGQVSAFTSEAGSFGGELLGWTPEVISTSEGQLVAAGDAVEPGSGLASPAQLGSAAAGRGQGTAVLGAGLELEIPTDTPPGGYSATLTLTVI